MIQYILNTSCCVSPSDSQELDILRASNSRLEEKLTDEKEGRRASEGQGNLNTASTFSAPVNDLIIFF
jgi:hypothetical protein